MAWMRFKSFSSFSCSNLTIVFVVLELLCILQLGLVLAGGVKGEDGDDDISAEFKTVLLNAAYLKVTVVEPGLVRWPVIFAANYEGPDVDPREVVRYLDGYIASTNKPNETRESISHHMCPLSSLCCSTYPSLRPAMLYGH